MYSRYGTSRIFGEKELSDFMNYRKMQVLESIEKEKEDYLLNVNEADYIEYKIEEARIENLELLFDDIQASSREEMIPAENFGFDFYVEQGKSYKKDVISFHIPYRGERELLVCIPSQRLLWSCDIKITNDEISFEIVNMRDDAESIIRDRDQKIQSIRKQHGFVYKDVNQYNSTLESAISNKFKSRKERILKSSGILASLGVPIKKTNASSTFSVPDVKKRKAINIRPRVSDEQFKPEPTLDNNTYMDILKIINDVGKEFERLPSVYEGKHEEQLRDHILMMLEPNFDGSATGETFNKNGKTDILLRYEGSNVFIGECKFWKGERSFLATISQLLGYLTWRDSKAAVIMFVRNKDFTKVLNTVEEAIPKHTNHLKTITKSDETWTNCEFHLNDDRNRVVKIAVMLFHLPEE